LTLKFNRVLEVVEVAVRAKFHQAKYARFRTTGTEKAVVHELSCAQRKKLGQKQYSPSLLHGQ